MTFIPQCSRTSRIWVKRPFDVRFLGDILQFCNIAILCFNSFLYLFSLHSNVVNRAQAYITRSGLIPGISLLNNSFFDFFCYIYVIKCIITIIFNFSSFKNIISASIRHLANVVILIMNRFSWCSLFPDVRCLGPVRIQPIARRSARILLSPSSAHNEPSLQNSPILRKNRCLIIPNRLCPFNLQSAVRRFWAFGCVLFNIYIYLYVEDPLNCMKIFLESGSKIDRSLMDVEDYTW